MSYTPNASFTFTTGSYTPSTAFDFEAGLQPNQGVIEVTGQTPVVKIKPDNMPWQGSIDITGQTPSTATGYRGQPGQCTFDIVGEAPIFAAWSIYRANQAELDIIGHTPTFTVLSPWRALQGEIDIVGFRPTFAFIKARQGTFDIIGQAPRFVAGFRRRAVQSVIELDGLLPIMATRVDQPLPVQWVSTRYRCYLTGSPDLELPFKSVQIRYNKEPDYRVYASVVVPGLTEFQAAITARQNGRLKVFRIYNLSDGSQQSFLMVDVPFTTIRSDEGPRVGRTGTLSGSAVISTPPNTFTIDLDNPMFRNESSEGLRYRCALDPRLRPGDTARINGDEFVVRTITHIIDARTTIMEIAA
ncbi:MAG: hypothetical protein PHT48_09510 [Dechloromonas sp.]|nr:hypothetical protein [Dechloromonas sp.]